MPPVCPEEKHQHIPPKDADSAEMHRRKGDADEVHALGGDVKKFLDFIHFLPPNNHTMNTPSVISSLHLLHRHFSMLFISTMFCLVF